MTRNHYLIAGACLVGLVLGYVAGSSSSSGGSEKAAEQTSSGTRPARSSSRDRQSRDSGNDELLSGLLKGRSPQDLSDGELVKIVVQLSKYDSTQSPIARARQNYQLQLLLEKLPVSRLQQAAEAMEENPDNRRGGGVNTILAAMVSKDSQRAMEWARSRKNATNLMAMVLGGIAKDDPMGAARIYREELLNGTFTSNDGWSASYGIANAMAQLGKKPLMDYLDSLPLQQQGNMLANCFREVPESERMALMEDVYQRTKDGRLQDWSFKNIFGSAAISDRLQAEAWLEKIPPGKERASLQLSAAGYIKRMGDDEGAREWMAGAISQSQGREKELLGEVIREFGYNSPSTIAAFAKMLPEGVEVQAEDLKSQASNSGYQGFSGLAALAGVIRDPEEQTKLVTTALDEFSKSTSQSSGGQRSNANDFEILSRQLQKLNLTGENAEKVQASLEAARNAKPKPKSPATNE